MPELRRAPGTLGVALRALRGAELIQVRVSMALVTVAVYLFIIVFYGMAVRADQIVMQPFKLKPRLFLMVKPPRLPV